VSNEDVYQAGRAQRLKMFALAFGFWTLLAFSYAVSSYISSINEGEPTSWVRILSWNLLNSYLWLLLSPWVGWLGRRGSRGSWRTFWALHLPASLAMAVAQSVVMLWLYWAVFGARAGAAITTFAAYVHVEFAYKFHIALITYWVLLVVLRSMESQRRLRDERLRNSQLETRLALRQALAAHPDVSIVGECGNAAEALQAIAALAPDLLFLDIQMPGLDGFKLLRNLRPQVLPMVVFATAFSQHALRAFDARAIDYVLKPIDQARFDQAMARVRAHWQGLHAAMRMRRWRRRPASCSASACAAASGFAWWRPPTSTGSAPTATTCAFMPPARPTCTARVCATSWGCSIRRASCASTVPSS